MTIINNLSGDFDTNWTAPSGAGTLSLLTQAQFLAERVAAGDSGASIPEGHVDGNKIAKVAITAGAGTVVLRGAVLDAGNFSDLGNITHRYYIPPEQVTAWEAASGVGSIFQPFMYSGVVGTTTGAYNGVGYKYTPLLDAVKTTLGSNANPVAPQFESGSTLLNFMSRIASTTATPTTFDYIDYYIHQDATSNTTFYLFDIVEIVEDVPKLYLRFDDGSDDHYLVAADKLDSYGYSAIFSIPYAFLGDANYMTEAQCLEMYTKYGFNLSVHGDGDGSTWGGAASPKQVMHDEITDIRNFFNNNNLPKCFSEVVTFVGNDHYSKTSDTEERIVKELARDKERLKVSTGDSQLGYGFSMGALSDGLNGVSTITFGDGAITGYINSAQDIAELLSYVKSTGLSMTCMFHVIDTSSTLGITEAEFDVILAAIDIEVQAGNVAVGDFMQDAYDAGLVTSPSIKSGDRTPGSTRTA